MLYCRKFVGLVKASGNSSGGGYADLFYLVVEALDVEYTADLVAKWRYVELVELDHAWQLIGDGANEKT